MQEIVAITEQIKNEAPGIKLDFWTEGKTKDFRIGDEVTFNFSADKECYVAGHRPWDQRQRDSPVSQQVAHEQQG